jgi:hypothetical protein
MKIYMQFCKHDEYNPVNIGPSNKCFEQKFAEKTEHILCPAEEGVKEKESIEGKDNKIKRREN